MPVRKFEGLKLLLPLIIIATLTLPSQEPAYADASPGKTEEQAVYAFNSQGASLATRKSAADQIITQHVKTSGHYLLKVLQNPKESKVLQNYVVEIIAKSKSPYILDLLEKQSLDTNLELYARKAFLYCLLKADVEKSISVARNIADNSYDDESLRFESIGYLSKDITNPDTIETVRNIFLNKKESLNLRKAAFFLLESMDDKKLFSEILINDLSDIEELQGFRQLAIEKLGSLNDPRLFDKLLSIFFDSKEKTPMRQETLLRLSEHKENLVEFLPKFKNLYHKLKFGDFKESVRQLISDLEKIKKQQLQKGESHPRKFPN